MERGKVLEILPSTHTASDECTIIIHIIFKYHDEAWGEKQSTSEKLKTVGGVLTTFISENKPKSLFLKISAQY